MDGAVIVVRVPPQMQTRARAAMGQCVCRQLCCGSRQLPPHPPARCLRHLAPCAVQRDLPKRLGLAAGHPGRDLGLNGSMGQGEDDRRQGNAGRHRSMSEADRRAARCRSGACWPRARAGLLRGADARPEPLSFLARPSPPSQAGTMITVQLNPTFASDLRAAGRNIGIQIGMHSGDISM